MSDSIYDGMKYLYAEQLKNKSVTLAISDRDYGVVERGMDMSHTVRNLLFYSFRQ